MTRRDHGKIVFLDIRDRSGIIQVVSNGEKAKDLHSEDVVCIEGNVAKRPENLINPELETGKIEISAESIEVISKAQELPFEIFGPTRPALDLRLDWRFLDLRRPENRLIFKVQTTAEMAMRQYWEQQDFIEIHSPKLLGAPSESAAELFQLDYFGKKAYLAQSPQFYKQMAMAAGFERVFEIGPVFRANPSFTSRHDTEFTSVDVEMSWIDSHEDVMSFEEKWIQFVVQKIKEKHGKEIKKLLGVEIEVPELPFPRVTLKEALELLKKQGHVPPPDKKGDLDPQGEKLLFEHIKKTKNHDFVFVTDYPVTARPFYHMRQEGDPTLTKSYDLLWKGLEVTTGAQREHRYEILVKQVKESGLKLELIQFYLDFFKFGCPPHGGFGFGLTRMLMIILGFQNVREVTYLYRGPHRLSP